MKLLIIGNGIAGAMVAWFARQKNLDFTILDESSLDTASRVSSGLINPVTGRYFAKSWRIDELLPFARNTYLDIQEHQKSLILKETYICRQLYSLSQENEWASRMQQDRFENYISLWKGAPPLPLNEKGVSAGRIDHVLQVNKERMLDSFCREYKRDGIFSDNPLVYDMIRQASDGWIYQDCKYDALVFCEGHKIRVNPFFSWVPIEPTKGEVIMVQLEGPPADGILKHHCFVIPWEDGTYWVGSNYEKEPSDPTPDPEQQTALEGRLIRSIGSDYKVIQRRAGIRPASRDRRPILGQHPEWKGIYLLNGLGTKGTLLGPYFASQLISHIVDGAPLDDEVNVSRWYPLYRESGMPGR